MTSFVVLIGIIKFVIYGDLVGYLID